MISLPFQPQFTWRKLGYLFFTDSLKYKDVLEENPEWDVTQLPPIGAQLRLPSPSVAGGLEQASLVFGVDSGNTADEIFPFDTTTEYLDAVSRYSLTQVNQRDRVNGYTMESDAAITGIQS